MERITEMHIVVTIVTMVMVNVSRETNIPVTLMLTLMHGVNFALMGLRLRAVRLHSVGEA